VKDLIVYKVHFKTTGISSSLISGRKKLIFLFLFKTSLIAQNSEVVYENIFLDPLKSSENLLVEGVKKHN
jgi:hypothetical protein